MALTLHDGHGSLSRAQRSVSHRPLIGADVRISRIRLSDWLRREAHETSHGPQASSAA
jgi:hypothetical protein